MLKTAMFLAISGVAAAAIAPQLFPAINAKVETPPRPQSAPAPAVAVAEVEAPHVSAGEHEISLPADPRGHFFADVIINGQYVRMMIDTGATAMTLSADTAQRLGLQPTPGSQRIRLQTANGVATAALTSLATVNVGPVIETDVRAIIADASAGPVNLIGMTFLSRLGGMESRDGMLTLRQ